LSRGGGGSLSCHTYCDTWPRFFRSHPNDNPIQSLLTTHERMWRIFSNLDPNESFHASYTWISICGRHKLVPCCDCASLCVSRDFNVDHVIVDEVTNNNREPIKGKHKPLSHQICILLQTIAPRPCKMWSTEVLKGHNIFIL
jgi:hypothetical protein